MPARHNDIMI